MKRLILEIANNLNFFKKTRGQHKKRPQLRSANDFQNYKESVLNEFDNFSQYIIGKTKNIFGIYFILIRHNENIKSFLLKETQNYKVFVLYCNDNFLDAGAPFLGNYNMEEQELLSILKTTFI